MLEKFFGRGGKENSKNPAQEGVELGEMVGEVHSTDIKKRYDKVCKESRLYFKDLGIVEGDKIEFRFDNGNMAEGVIESFGSLHTYLYNPESDFIASARVEGRSFTIYPKDLKTGRAKRI
ncbi:MAG: hypothetical protein A2534_02995 [Candidatus Magasanikbacteria bacterium RIFOXYD2_FULL_39_9]|uniref:Uncharacterized protein n=1 Tax=Candidatus Magasanikbacteria bacterium RIFOXYD1_FULL_40_23 TaxID=1798705 RepID=A0A1F6P8J9_9BACT|nr:MAG: hypothetical protein A2534_02995 [Candidatus Magasanikbacteria bacterium RIFOXYD2_FULL_39_9]OGH92293.1 MAG: hypothetical protein A2563_04895 [Candidatus Magasanikbacteria bacterium RIFOXYD1_FULL_40_23]